MVTQLPLDTETFDALMHALPVHVFFFDRELLCRYAAPAGPFFLGQPAGELLGRHVQAVFPAETALTPYLSAVLETREAWRANRLSYPAGPEETWPAGIWEVYAQPHSISLPATAGRRGGDRRRRQDWRGVLVSCIEVDGSDDRLRVNAPGAGSDPATSVAAAFGDGRALESRRCSALVERVRTKLTVIRGFTQLLHWRQRAAHPEADLAELARINEATNELSELLSNYERSDDQGPSR